MKPLLLNPLAWAALLTAALGLAAAGCDTTAFCFEDCEGGDTTDATGTGGAGGTGGLGLTTGSGGCLLNCTGTGGAGGACVPTNGGIEICDELDNDCDGLNDNSPDIDFSNPATCGTCDNSCLVSLTNCAPEGILCVPSPDPGAEPGDCQCTQCATDYIDLDNDGKTCEYYCVLTPGATDDSVCNNKDDDCDGVKDEDVALCTSTTDCGKCGGNCVVLHGTPACVNSGAMPCDQANTQCQIASCDCAPGDCWWDLDDTYITGCEYPCELTNGGVEICGDGLDNDCDGLIDGVDDLSGDPQIGVTCFGDPDGICGTPAHAGMTACQGGQVVCGGPLVLVENQTLEVCNGADDDCDGAIDDSPINVGASCGLSNIFPCSFGSQQCLNGALTCVGAVNPGVETCNAQDDNCDGAIDMNGANPPLDSVGPCNVPPPAPPGATQPCVAGSRACVGGVVVCQGSVGPTSVTDGCGDDSNCNGLLESQPNLLTDVNHCGSCVNNCYAGAMHSIWTCEVGVCAFQGCESGYFDLDNDQQCEYACVFIQAQEICNGIDDDCDGQTDEGVIAPLPTQVCGVSPSATAPECTLNVGVACVGGLWSCTFPAGVCSGGCSPDDEICDGLDNDCDGALNENVANYNKPCASDDGLPPPGHGACKTNGVYVCNGANATTCSGVKADCLTLPGMCVEVCDAVDNDCDGLVDEPFDNKGMNAQFFVKPVATKIANNQWIMSHEASRPTATVSTPGSGNGFYCTASPPATTCSVSGVTVPVAPTNAPREQTAACSVPDRIPWFNVSPVEVEQTCAAMGGFVCSTTNWQASCAATAACGWGYDPRGAACTSSFTATKFCNLGPSFDFVPGAGDQDGLLATGSAALQHCWADWSGLQANTAATNKVFDITGNLREITKAAANQYRLMGGAFNTQNEAGAACGFTFYTVDMNFKLFDAGFRCCFDADPTL